MKKILICNHKMFLTHDEAILLRNSMDDIDFSEVDLIICPSFLNFDVFENYKLGAQNCHYANNGAYTGEISAYDLSLRNIKYVIVGHSERRKYDTDSEINLKIASTLKNNMTPILCIGESKMDRDLRRTTNVLKKQLFTAVDKLEMNKDQELIVAYEPVWAIGGDTSLSKEEMEDALIYIRKLLEQKNILNYKLLYGGSVNSNNIESILSDKVDGYLLGNSSINENELGVIVKCIK